MEEGHAKCFVVHSERYHVPNGQRQAHNQLMNVAAETGIVGLICFLAWVAYYAVFLFKLRQLRTGTISRAMWLAAMGSFVVVAAHGIVDATFGAELSPPIHVDYRLSHCDEGIGGLTS